MSGFLIIYFCMLVSQITCNPFDNYTMYEVTAFNHRERSLLYFLYVRNEMIVFLNGITNEAAVPMDVIVDVCCTKFFEEKLQDNDIEYEIVANHNLVANLQDRIIKTAQKDQVPNITTAFYSFESLLFWVESKLRKFPVLKKIVVAKTFENREVFVLKISTGKKNTAVFVMGGEEGRDWFSPSILLNFIEYILEHQQNVELLIKHYDFYILPIFNPDGYVYSAIKSPYWTQNRKIYFPKKKCSKNESIIGINVDRNWFFSKDIIRNDECDPVYSGSKSISEKETEGLAEFLDSIALQMLAFINVRSFEYLVTIPYGYNLEYCNNHPVLLDIITSVHDRFREEHNKTFFFGTTAEYLYNFTGNVADWVKKKLNTPIVYTFYMKADHYLFPGTKDIQPLTNEFSTMMKEVLLLARSIYSPLFNHQTKNSIQIIFIILNLVCTSTLQYVTACNILLNSNI